MKRVGLFVGIDNYQNGITPLQCAVNDAKELSYSFARAGFQADFIDNEQCDSITITNKIRAMLKDLKKDDIFVFYFRVMDANTADLTIWQVSTVCRKMHCSVLMLFLFLCWWP